MLNEERVILMTKMEIYEENEGRKYVAIGHFFRSDYISLQILKSIICATIAFGVVFGLYILYDFEVFMEEIYDMDLLEFAKNVLIAYAVSVVAFGVITYVVYSYRYAKARRSLKNYYGNLKKLNALYSENENRQ